VDGPPLDPEDWSDEQWQDYLRATADHDIDGSGSDSGAGASTFRRLRASGAGAVIGAGMLGLEQALYGERPKEEIVAESESDDPDRDRSVFDPDDPRSAVVAIPNDPPPELDEP